MVERTIQTLKNFIRVNKEDGKSTTDSLQLALRTMRTTVHTRIGKSPFELHFGREPRKEIHNLLGSTKETIDWLKGNNVSANEKTVYAYAFYNEAGEPSDHIVLSRKKSSATVRRSKSPMSPLTPVSKLPYFCYEKRINPKTTQSKFKREPIKIISETKHTVLTENGRRLHKKLVSKPVKFQPNYTNRGKGPRDPKTMKFVKAEETGSPGTKKEETMEADAVTSSTPLIDLTQSTSSSGSTEEEDKREKNIDKTPAIRLNRKLAEVSDNNNIEGSKPRRKIKPVIKYGGIHYS